MGKTLLSLWGLKPPDPPAEALKSSSDAASDAMSVDTPSQAPETPSMVCTLRATPERLRDVTPSPHAFFAPKTKSAPVDCPLEAPVTELAPEALPPVVMCTLRAQPEKLRALKPRVHGFFVKKTAPPPSQLASELKLIIMPSQTASWPKLQVRAPRSAPVSALARRKRLKPLESRPRKGSSGPASNYGPPLPTLAPPGAVERPQRRLMTADTARQTAGLKLPQNDPLFNHMVHLVGVPQPFDLGQWENQLWSQKYAPRNTEHCLSPGTRRAVRWLKKQIKTLKSGPIIPRRRTEMDDFIDDSGSSQHSYLLLHGPSGSGKTAAVYAAASELGAFVFEVNSSQKRGGKELTSLLDGIGHSRAVHSGGQSANNDTRECIILLDDVDVLYESEATFFSALDRIAATTRRPIVMTCQDLDRLPFSVLDAAKQIYIGPGDLARTVDYAWLVAFCEGHLISKETVAHTVVRCNGDIRKSLAHLQLWCQMGLGGRSSASDWVLTEPGFDRVISVGTPVPLPESPYTTPPAAPSALNAEELPEMLSCLDACRHPTEYCEPFEDALQGITAPEYVETAESPIENYIKAPYPRVVRRHLHYLRDAVWCAGRSDLLVTDYAPFTRLMALADRERAITLAKSGASRQSRRSWAALGIDGRQHVANGERVLQLGGPTSS